VVYCQTVETSQRQTTKVEVVQWKLHCIDDLNVKILCKHQD